MSKKSKYTDPTQTNFLEELFNPVSEPVKPVQNKSCKKNLTIPIVSKFNYRDAVWTLYILASFFDEEVKSNTALMEKKKACQERVVAYRKKVKSPGERLINLGKRAIDCAYQNTKSELRQLNEEVELVKNAFGRDEQRRVLSRSVQLLDQITAEVYRSKTR